MPLDWILEADGKPNDGEQVIVWIACDGCLNGEHHPGDAFILHNNIFTEHRWEGFGFGRYWIPDLSTGQTYLHETEDGWDPVKPYAWARVTPPEGRGKKR